MAELNRHTWQWDRVPKGCIWSDERSLGLGTMPKHHGGAMKGAKQILLEKHIRPVTDDQ